MKKRFLSILLALCMVLAVLQLAPISANAATFDSTWIPLTSEITEFNGGDSGYKYYLADDVTINTFITVKGGTADNPIIVDLNGHTLTMSGSTCVFKINQGVHLTLKDSSAEKTGAVIGTNNANSFNGAGGVVHNLGTFTLESGRITGHAARIGGGVFNEDNATFTMKGGTISGCSAGLWGGGVCNYGIFTMEGGTISDCSAGGFAGGVENAGTFTMEGGMISGCTAVASGDGVRNRGTLKTGATICYDDLENQASIDGKLVEFYNDSDLYAWEIIPDGGKVVKPTDPTKTGFGFEGWYTEDSFANEWNFDTDTVSNNIQLYAKLTPKAYTVSFDTAGGTEIDAISIGWDGVVLENVENPEKEGFVFVDWTFNGDTVAEDAVLSDLIDDDTLTGITLTANWDEIITVSLPFTTEVKLGDAGKPGETEFDLAIVHASMSEEYYAHVTVSGTVSTNGAGEYDGMLTLTGPYLELEDMLCRGAIVQQVNGGEANWTYDDTVWGLKLYDGAMYAGLNDEQEQTPAMLVDIFPATCELTENGLHYDLDWDAVYAYQPVDKMTFTNTYTAHEYALKHDANGHWNECACGDVQNKEAHKYGEWKVTKEATTSAKGEKEHVCSVCKYTETAEIPMLEKTEPPKTDSPQTGDNSNMPLCIVLLLVSGSALIGVAAYDKKRKRSAK